MAADLGEAIGLQGRPNTTSARTVFMDTVRMGQMQKQEKAAKEQAERAGRDKQAGQLDKIIADSINIDYNKFHDTDRDAAAQAANEYAKQVYETYNQRDPNYLSKARAAGQQLAINLANLQAASKEKFTFEDYANKGGYLDDNAKAYQKYLATKNPAYLESIDLKKGGVIQGVEPKFGSASFKPVKPMNLPAYISQNYYIDKGEKVAGRDGRFDIIEDVYNMDTVNQLARADIRTNPDLKDWVQSQFQPQVINKLKNFTDPVTGKNRYNLEDPYTFQDPTFQQDYEKALEDTYADYATSIEGKKTQRLAPIPKDNITNINVGTGGKPIDNTIQSENLEIPFGDTAGNSKVAVSGISYGMEGQKILIPKGEYLTNIQNGEKLSQKGVTDATVSGIYVLPVYDEGTKIKGYGANNKLYDYGNTLVGKDDIETGRAGNILKYQYKPIAFIKIGNSTYYGDAEKLTGASRYFDASEAEKPLVVKTFEQAKQDALERNKGIGSKSKPTPATKPSTPPSSNKKKISGF